MLSKILFIKVYLQNLNIVKVILKKCIFFLYIMFNKVLITINFITQKEQYLLSSAKNSLDEERNFFRFLAEANKEQMQKIQVNFTIVIF